MKKFLAVLFVAAFAVSLVVGLVITPAKADGDPNPRPCKFECIDGDTYLCCLRNGYWGCGFYEEGCGEP